MQAVEIAVGGRVSTTRWVDGRGRRGRPAHASGRHASAGHVDGQVKATRAAWGVAGSRPRLFGVRLGRGRAGVRLDEADGVDRTPTA
jgi:hypothetical protein